MKKASLPSLFVVAIFVLWTGDAAAQTGSSSFSCPPNYALRIDPQPPPTDDPGKTDTHKPLSAAEKLQADQQEQDDEKGRMHCVPLNSIRSQGPNQ